MGATSQFRAKLNLWVSHINFHPRWVFFFKLKILNAENFAKKIINTARYIGASFFARTTRLEFDSKMNMAAISVKKFRKQKFERKGQIEAKI